MIKKEVFKLLFFCNLVHNGVICNGDKHHCPHSMKMHSRGEVTQKRVLLAFLEPKK